MVDIPTVALAVSGPVTALVFAGVQKILHAGAREAAKDEMREQLRGEFAQFKAELMAAVEGSYRRTSECTLISGNICQRLDDIDGKVREVQEYAHERAHTLSNELQKIVIDFTAQINSLRRSET
jgi:chromosome condensin MukBEF MukE localization factor